MSERFDPKTGVRPGQVWRCGDGEPFKMVKRDLEDHWAGGGWLGDNGQFYPDDGWGFGLMTLVSDVPSEGEKP